MQEIYDCCLPNIRPCFGVWRKKRDILNFGQVQLLILIGKIAHCSQKHAAEAKDKDNTQMDDICCNIQSRKSRLVSSVCQDFASMLQTVKSNFCDKIHQIVSLKFLLFNLWNYCLSRIVFVCCWQNDSFGWSRPIPLSLALS